MITKSPKSGWQLVKFGDVVRQCKESVDRKNNPFERYVEGGHMDSEHIHISRWGTFGVDYVGPAFHRIFRRGQVLYGSRRTYLKKIALADFDGITANTTFVCETKDPNIFKQELLPFLMLSDAFTENSIRESKGSTNPYINWPDIAKFEFQLPPLHEQRQISEILWESNSAIEQSADLRKRLEMASRVYFFQQIVNGTNKHFRGISAPPRNCQWQFRRLRDAGEIQLGRQRAPKYQSGKWTRPYLRVANVFDGFIDTSDVLQMDFNEEEFVRYKLKHGDILLNEGQSRELLGRCAMFEGQIADCCFQNTLIRFRCGSDLIPLFAFFYFQHLFYRQTYAAVGRQTTSMAHLGADNFRKLYIPIPSIEEQNRVVATMNGFRELGTAVSCQIEKVKKAHRSLIGHFLGANRV